MFGRKKDEAAPVAEAAPERPGAKNRPTPTRKEAEAANKRPLVPTDRKAAAKAQRAAMRDARVKERQAQFTGDESHLPARDKGPERRYIRDYVDARWSVGEFLLPIMLVVLVLSFVRQSMIQLVVFLLVYGLIIVAAIDCAIMWRRIKKGLQATLGHGASKGSLMYAVMRAFQIRRSRLPRPQVARGEYPG